jgi:Na+/H+ antiporter NhaD/arsenite permease-like protein
MRVTGVVIFAATYVLISARRLGWLGWDRPAAALVGAVACVVFRVLSPDEALSAIDGETLLLLFGVMGMGAFLAVDDFFGCIERALLAFAATGPRLLGTLIWGSGILSALITNDAVCVLAAPLVVGLIRKQRLPALPFLLALATAANTGSVATLLGNPQNMLCGRLGGLSYGQHFLWMAPVAVIGLAINHALLHFAFRRSLRDAVLIASAEAPRWSARMGVTLIVIMGTAVAAALGASLAWAAAAGFVLLMLLHRRQTSALWPLMDWELLLFFAGLFVVVEGFTRTGVPDALFARFPLPAGDDFTSWLGLSTTFLIGSNVVSNVPFILLVGDQVARLPDARIGWELLAMASTFAGNLTLLGSVANLIVAEAASELGGISFWQYFRIGFPLALLTTFAGLSWLWLATHVF